jgi:excisionase family DNA binding protein
MAKLLTVHEVAQSLGVKPATVRAWVLRRKITSFRVGRAVRISEEEIGRVLRDGLRPAKGPPEKGGKYG